MELFRVELEAGENEKGNGLIIFNESFFEFATEEEIKNLLKENEIKQLNEITNNVYHRVRELALR